MAIISFEYNFIFIKTTKTAGTSIEVDLGRLVEPDAIVTPIDPPSTKHLPRNYRTDRGDLYNHIAASSIREIIGAARFARMTKFCVEREPISKCISHFHMVRNSRRHRTPETKQLSWAEYCERAVFPKDIHRYCENAAGRWNTLVDVVLDYDRLETDLPSLLGSLGLRDFKLVSREKSEYSSPRWVTPQEVSPAQAHRIREAFAAELELLDTIKKAA